MNVYKKFLFFLLHFFAMHDLCAQEGSQITGSVVDKCNEAIPFVNVNLTGKSGNSLTSTTDFDGMYSFKSIPAGTYTLIASFLGCDTDTIHVDMKNSESKKLMTKMTCHNIVCLEPTGAGVISFHNENEPYDKTRLKWYKKSSKPVFNCIPDSSFLTIKKSSYLSGEVISICKGAEIHHGGTWVGVIKIRSQSDSMVYCVLTQAGLNLGYKINDNIKIKINPLKKTDKYFSPRQLTCESIDGDVICILEP